MLNIQLEDGVYTDTSAVNAASGGTEPCIRGFLCGAR